MSQNSGGPNSYAPPPAAAESRGQTILAAGQIRPLLFLFGALYFVQGIVEPTACLPAQPMQSQLRGWGLSTELVGHFFWIIGIAWSIKPLFGLLSDFFPIGGRRRRPYLILSTAAAGAAFLALGCFWGQFDLVLGGWPDSAFRWLTGLAANQPAISQSGWLLVMAGVALATTDVVIDALAVETGQPLGITGQIQSVQWCALSVAGLIAGTLGGFVAQHHLQRPMFFGCGFLALGSLVIVLVLVKEQPRAGPPVANLRLAWDQLLAGRRLTILLSAAAFLFLWNFNPFSSNVLQDYMTTELRFSEQFYGHLTSIQSAAQIVACLAYGWYCRRVPLGWLVHGSIVAGILSTLTYWLLHDAWTAVLSSIVFGLAYQTATLIQLDLSARICPTQSAGTMFALLMALSNTGVSAGVYLGGGWYDWLASAPVLGDRQLAFHALVAIGAAFTAGCWLLVPVMKWAGVDWK